MTMEPIKILLVDDVPENLVALEALLRRDGVTILTARTGAAALELLLVHEVSLALVDVQMPEMDGFELAELMRGTERTKHVPMIFVTAGTRDPRRVFKGYESGAVDFLFKPIDPHILRSKVDVFLELARQRAELANALRLNEMFVAVVGHDLRNPLSALSSGIDLLGMYTTDPMQTKTLARMTDASKRMVEMIEQLLDLSRARLGGGVGFVRQRQQVAIDTLVRRVIDELHASYPDREIALDITGDCSTAGDPERLLQLFSNIVSNALSHGVHDGAVTATVAGNARDVVVRVDNAGTIPPDQLATLFEPFHGRAKARTSASKGLGLGMYISRQIALAHGGEITVECPAGATCVVVRLPRVAGSSSLSKAG